LTRTKFTGVIAAALISSFVAPLSWAGQRSQSQSLSASQGVALIARMPETASLAWLINPVPQNSLQDGQTAEMVVLRETWAFAGGQTLDAECQVTTGPQATAQVFTSRGQYPATGFAASFLETSPVQTFPLVTNFDPAKGSVTDTQILLIIHNAGDNESGGDASASVRITVVAL